MFDFRYYIDLITEAQHDALVDAIIRQFPDKEKEIRDHAIWANQVLKKADRINWYLGKLRAYLSDQLTPEVLGDYQFTTMQQLQHDLAHFYGYNSPAIEAYQYQRQPIGNLIRDLEHLESEWTAKQTQERGVDPQEGDYVLFEFADGIKWWWINRAYCPEEGRSGRHCGNVVGQHKTDQQILSLRNARNQVILTFILEPNGTLGEMKAKGNQKPQEKFHPHIMKLLLWDKITGISGMGYLPDMNFSVFDLNEEYLNYLDQRKPKLIVDQIQITPFDILGSSNAIKQKYQEVALKREPLINDVLFDSSLENWTSIINQKKELLVYLPIEYYDSSPNFKDQLLNLIAGKLDLLLKCPVKIRKDPIFLEKLIKMNSYAIGYILTTTRNYEYLCKVAVNKESQFHYQAVLRLIPKEYRTFEICKIAVSKDSSEIEHVPSNIEGYTGLCEVVVNKSPYVLRLIPEGYRTFEICKIAVFKDVSQIEHVPSNIEGYTGLCEDLLLKNRTDDYLVSLILDKIPKEKRSYRLAKIVVPENPKTLWYFPSTIENYDKLAEIAASNSELNSIEEEHRTYKLCKMAVIKRSKEIVHVPHELEQYDKLAELAISKDIESLKFLPKTSKYYEKFFLPAVISDATALKYVPYELRTFELCKIAVSKDPMLLRDVNSDIKGYYKLCEIAVSKNSLALCLVNENYRTFELCKMAVDNSSDRRIIQCTPPQFYYKIFDYWKSLYHNKNENINYILTLTKKLLKS